LEADIKLTPTSYIVLGLLTQVDEATPYDLKALVAAGVGNLWSLQHTQLYAEPERLTKAGYLTERREKTGRRRKLYSITAAGREALAGWLSAGPVEALPELRDLNLLKIFFGADPRAIAESQALAHRDKLREYTDLERALTAAAGQDHDQGDGQDDGQLTALRAGIGHEREWIRYWTALKDLIRLNPGEPSGDIRRLYS
jgi:PadR family transcriptional regulator, regulatory protein AphA